jgi:hypothetical protein
VTEPDLVQIAKGLETMGSNIGRTIEQWKGFYNATANSLRDRLGSRSEDVFMNLVEVPKENRSFGNGDAQCGHGRHETSGRTRT